MMISEFPLFIFTLLCGMAVGLYGAAACFPQERGEGRKEYVLSLVALVLLAVSGVALLGHLGHPERAFNAFRNMGAGIAQEGVTVMAFGLMIAVDMVVCMVKGTAVRGVRIAAAVLGLVFIAAVCSAYQQLIGVAVSAHFATVLFFIVGSYAMGFSLYALLSNAAYEKKTFVFVCIALDVLLGCSLALMAVAASSSVSGSAPFIWSIVPAAIIPTIILATNAGRNKPWAPVVVFILVTVGLAIARYSFYMSF